tara:strand:+ start:2525 stop:3394 length:870 start_codon:yes stop_codon:yes gene_type:complete
MRVLLVLCILSLTTNAQNLQDFKEIDNNYNSYLKSIFGPSFTKKTKQKYKVSKNIVFGKLKQCESVLQLTKQHSFSISTWDKEDKLMAAILHGAKHHATYEFVADDYEQCNGLKSIVIKEFLRMKIHAIPDTNTMKVTGQYKINSLETITQFSHNKLIFLKQPITILFYASHQENTNGIYKSSKTIIKHHDKTLYNSVQNNNLNTLKHNSKMNQHLFVYRYKNQNKLIKGGLMGHILTNFLTKIKDDIHINAIHVSNVSDIYSKDIKDLKRIYCRGKLMLRNKNIELLI